MKFTVQQIIKLNLYYKFNSTCIRNGFTSYSFQYLTSDVQKSVTFQNGILDNVTFFVENHFINSLPKLDNCFLEQSV
jgi:hypothetical protein